VIKRKLVDSLLLLLWNYHLKFKPWFQPDQMLHSQSFTLKTFLFEKAQQEQKIFSSHSGSPKLKSVYRFAELSTLHYFLKQSRDE
jgi:hypothetical protein